MARFSSRLSSADSSIDSLPPDPTSINLTRLLARLQSTLTTPDATTEKKLQTSSFEREKVASNIEYARSLLLHLEQDGLQIKAQNKKQETQMELIRKRNTINRLAERLGELNELGHEVFDDGDDSSEGEDLIGEDTPGDETETDDQASHNDLTPPLSVSPTLGEHETSEVLDMVGTEREPDEKLNDQTGERVVESSTLRARNPRAELFAQNTHDTGISTATTEALLTHNRAEQESLTASMLNMAQQLKLSSHAFATSLDDEKGILDSATSGLDKNELGMEAAQRRMGHLRSVSEGRGWWGRMQMYAYIAALMVLALVIVFVLPKLRF